mmetsp:Transcript_5097/g.12813  ORF Transcript_5097/g.12813 Transcript_5097/m.12813 type:complete len:337 (+) Transcript_5097:1287-2297(+)
MDARQERHRDGPGHGSSHLPPPKIVRAVPAEEGTTAGHIPHHGRAVPEGQPGGRRGQAPRRRSAHGTVPGRGEAHTHEHRHHLPPHLQRRLSLRYRGHTHAESHHRHGRSVGGQYDPRARGGYLHRGGERWDEREQGTAHGRRLAEARIAHQVRHVHTEHGRRDQRAPSGAERRASIVLAHLLRLRGVRARNTRRGRRRFGRGYDDVGKFAVRRVQEEGEEGRSDSHRAIPIDMEEQVLRDGHNRGLPRRRERHHAAADIVDRRPALVGRSQRDNLPFPRWEQRQRAPTHGDLRVRSVRYPVARAGVRIGPSHVVTDDQAGVGRCGGAAQSREDVL